MNRLFTRIITLWLPVLDGYPLLPDAPHTPLPCTDCYTLPRPRPLPFPRLPLPLLPRWDGRPPRTQLPGDYNVLLRLVADTPSPTRCCATLLRIYPRCDYLMPCCVCYPLRIYTLLLLRLWLPSHTPTPPLRYTWRSLVDVYPGRTFADYVCGYQVTVCVPAHACRWTYTRGLNVIYKTTHTPRLHVYPARCVWFVLRLFTVTLLPRITCGDITPTRLPLHTFLRATRSRYLTYLQHVPGSSHRNLVGCY